ncbi:PadR family transcriptional regulator [Paenibacillus sp. NFR01]|uniref:PadR family transcriptional regulator n=1 Tax=Paenibacillus sp. NFR01 TaxID=1566279 RepID=UPI0008AB3761|nr:PadR family transcriptional regulator [Paenibacillus sp. NFR01]SET20167.1 DNA-binding transcriptional regulator, PadR family [Paenibacillus sp. NFR01]
MSLQIFILGTLSRGEHHPYDIKKKVPKSLNNIISYNDGTLYYHIEALLKKGYIQKLEVVQSENRPEKTTYGITDLGREALKDEIYSVFDGFTDIRRLYPSLFFLDMVDPVRLSAVIERAIQKLKNKIDRIERADLSPLQPKERFPLELVLQHAHQSKKNDLQWLTGLLEQVKQRMQAGPSHE